VEPYAYGVASLTTRNVSAVQGACERGLVTRVKPCSQPIHPQAQTHLPGSNTRDRSSPARSGLSAAAVAMVHPACPQGQIAARRDDKGLSGDHHRGQLDSGGRLPGVAQRPSPGRGRWWGATRSRSREVRRQGRRTRTRRRAARVRARVPRGPRGIGPAVPVGRRRAPVQALVVPPALPSRSTSSSPHDPRVGPVPCIWPSCTAWPNGNCVRAAQPPRHSVPLPPGGETAVPDGGQAGLR
jgi:hypothetical protein